MGEGRPGWLSCSCRPLGIPQLPEQLLKVRELIGEGEGMLCVWGGGWIGAGWRLPALQLLCRSSWAELGVQDFRVPLPPPLLLTRWRLKSLNL